MIRVTTNSVLKNYRQGLYTSRYNLYNSMTSVMSQRSFNSYAENPAAAAQAFQLRRSIYRTEGQLTNNNAIKSKFDSAYAALRSVKEIAENSSQREGLSALNEPTGSGRPALGTLLQEDAKNMLQSMNARYGDSFVFAGADGLNVPFSWDNNGNLTFRGINVNAPEGSADYKKLQQLAGETCYIDIGLGLKEDTNGNIISSSAFDASLSGLNFIQFGVDADGDPKNIISLTKQLGEILSRCDDDGNYASETDREDANRIQGKLSDALGDLTSAWSELSTKTTFLKQNEERLNSNRDTATAQLESIERIDPAYAISELSYAQFCYNAALKIGNSILSPSLIDYMN